MARNQEALKDLIETTLNANSYNVDFNTDLYNTDDIKYYEADTLGQKRRFVPTMISDVIGEYINIPNANSTSNNVSINFDVFVDVENDLDDVTDTELEKVNYNNTLNAIEEFKGKLLAQYYPLGTPYLYMGGEDSSFTGTTTTNNAQAFYIKFNPYNTDTERLLDGTSSTQNYIYKNATDVIFNDGTNTIRVPYQINTDNEITIYKTTTPDRWNITNGTDVDSMLSTNIVDYSVFEFGGTIGFEGLVKRLVITNESFSDIENASDLNIDISTWLSKDTLTNSGDTDLISSSISNSILWSEDGNAIFGFGTLNPVSGIRLVDGQFLYQEFEMEMSVFISNDLLFGNNFEYYLDGIQVYPVDRSHTLATESGSAQYTNQNYNTSIVEESLREHTMSFYYIPTKQLTSLLKHVVSGDTAQNTTYELVVQYPFFQVTYYVILESGGTNPNINTLSTFTVVFKRKDSSLT